MRVCVYPKITMVGHIFVGVAIIVIFGMLIIFFLKHYLLKKKNCT